MDDFKNVVRPKPGESEQFLMDRQAAADDEYWMKLARAFNWKLHGFSNRWSASFYTRQDKPLVYDNPLECIVVQRANPRDFIQITGEQRDQMMHALNHASQVLAAQRRAGKLMRKKREEKSRGKT